MILCLGTTPALQRTMVFDRVELDAVNRAAEVREYASGKPVNAARVLHTLGRPARVTGFLGGDTGRAVRRDLDRAGVRHDFLEVSPPTRVCVTVVDRATSQATELIEESSAVEARDYDALLDKLGRLLVGASALVMLGSLPPNAPGDFYARCVNLATGAGVRSILDAKGEPLRRALAARPFVVKPNQKELQETLGADIGSGAAMRDGIRRLLEGGPAWAVVTSGAEGAVVSDGERFWRIAAPRVPAVSPIGSGDALAAGLAAGIAAGLPVPDACALGVACGAANAMTALAGHVDPVEVDRLRPRVRVEAW